MIIQIHSLGYSGSTLLNACLDSVLGIRGLGEISRTWTKDSVCPCSVCGPKCKFYDGVESILDIHQLYPGDILVDSSKEYSYPSDFSIVLFKYPHEFAESYQRHNGATVTQSFKLWMSFYAGVSNANYILPFRRFCQQPETELSQICRSIGIEYHVDHDWWETDTHVIGGNTSVTNQYHGIAESQKKYAKIHNHHQIVVDDYWRCDNQLKKDCLAEYEKQRTEFQNSFCNLGITVDEMIVDCLQSKLL